MKLIYTLILLLFSSSVFADFVDIEDISISDLLGYGFEVKQIDTLNYSEHVFHLKRGGTTIAICYIEFLDTHCMIDKKNEKLLDALFLNS